MTSVHSSSLDADEVDLSGLVESVVDSDEEDLAESMDVSKPRENHSKSSTNIANYFQLTFRIV